MRFLIPLQESLTANLPLALIMPENVTHVPFPSVTLTFEGKNAFLLTDMHCNRLSDGWSLVKGHDSCTQWTNTHYPW